MAIEAPGWSKTWVPAVYEAGGPRHAIFQQVQLLCAERVSCVTQLRGENFNLERGLVQIPGRIQKLHPRNKKGEKARVAATNAKLIS